MIFRATGSHLDQLTSKIMYYAALFLTLFINKYLLSAFDCCHAAFAVFQNSLKAVYNVKK